VTKAELDLCSVALLSIIFFFKKLKMKPLSSMVKKNFTLVCSSLKFLAHSYSFLTGTLTPLCGTTIFNIKTRWKNQEELVESSNKGH